jgi:MraZ protein
MTTLNKGFYVGTYRHTLDVKGRLTIPSKWRFSGDEEEGSYLALPNPNGSITVYPPKTTAALEAKIENVSMLADKDELNALMQLFATGDRFGCDAQGRIGLTEELRRYAGLVKDAILIGTVTTFHIWAPEKCPASGTMTPGKLNFDPALLRKYGL